MIEPTNTEMAAAETVSSSPPRPLPRSALVVRLGRVTGPIQLPLDDPLTFIADFNARYQAAGLRIIAPQP